MELRVDQGEGGVLGPVTGRVDRPDAHGPERELPAVVERLMRVVGSRQAVDVDRGASGLMEPTVPRDVIGVVMGLEHMSEPDAQVAGGLQVPGDIEAGVDDRGDARLLVPHEVGSAAKVVLHELAEDHARAINARTGPRAALGGASPCMDRAPIGPRRRL